MPKSSNTLNPARSALLSAAILRPGAPGAAEAISSPAPVVSYRTVDVRGLSVFYREA